MSLPFKVVNNGESGVIQAEKEYFERDCMTQGQGSCTSSPPSTSQIIIFSKRCVMSFFPLVFLFCK